MAKDVKAVSEAEKVRLQVTLCQPVASELSRHAIELDRSQAWVSAWAIRTTLDDPQLFSQWMLKRLKKPEAHQEWKPSDDGKEVRLQIRVEPETAKRLELAAISLNQSPLKLAGLMIEHGLGDWALKLLKTWPGKLLREFVRGRENPNAYDADETQPEGESNDK